MINLSVRFGTRNENPERGTRIRNEERESGTRNETLVEARETLRPCPNGVITRGNEDPPCVYMGEQVTLFLDVLLGVNVPGTTLSVTGNHVMY